MAERDINVIYPALGDGANAITFRDALQDDGWYLRSDIIWNKPNVMPESVKDRPSRAHEYLFMFTKNEQYYFNHAAIPTVIE